MPRLAFGIGSLMQWNEDHTRPLLSGSSREVRQAVAAGFRHLYTGGLYTKKDSAARALEESDLEREDLFVRMKLHLRCSRRHRQRGHRRRS